MFCFLRPHARGCLVEPWLPQYSLRLYRVDAQPRSAKIRADYRGMPDLRSLLHMCRAARLPWQILRSPAPLELHRPSALTELWGAFAQLPKFPPIVFLDILKIHYVRIFHLFSMKIYMCGNSMKNSGFSREFKSNLCAGITARTLAKTRRPSPGPSRWAPA